MLSKKLAAVAAISMISASSAAVAQSAQPLSLSNNPVVGRVGAPAAGQSNLESRGYGTYILGAVILGLIIWGVIELTKDNKSKSP